MRGRRDVLGEIARRKLLELRNLTFATGTVAGNVFNYNMATILLDVAAMDVPEGAGMAAVPIPFRAYASAEGVADSLIIQSR